ncbi:methyltransferase [Streptomyces sp. G-G2]|uniref:methyltransferase n=1 Tax=Streptomyces sp. G-G2 TaxID=3046201 RepID=UPI0024BB8AD5|nr:methyltransferase [Streptomyces sp. G-G2]MDJ0383056.1 methyltransferase [Streptomyces sp. G-G2]
MTSQTIRPTGRVAVPDGAQARNAWRMRELIYGQLRSRAIGAMAELGLADVLGHGARTADQLASQVGADRALLPRLLRALASFEILHLEHRDGQQLFSLTPLGETLRSDGPGSALPTALLVASTVAPAWERLTQVVRTGRPAFTEVFGQDFFSHLGDDTRLRGIFDRSQETGLALELEGLLGAVDFTGPLSVADIGGGDAALLTGLLADRPELRGTLVDLAAALPPAALRLAGARLTERCELREGNFFEALPAGADRYVLRHILHDWDDESCVAILRNCRAAMSPDARLVLIDHLAAADPGAAAGEGSTGQWGGLMDLYMMSLFDGGRERTEEETRALLGEAGLTALRVTRLPGGTGVIEARGALGEPRPSGEEGGPHGAS